MKKEFKRKLLKLLGYWSSCYEIDEDVKLEKDRLLKIHREFVFKIMRKGGIK